MLNLAPSGRARQSSTSRWSTENDAAGALQPPRRPYGFHTDLEDGPWWELRFDAPCAPDRIVVHNRRDRLQERASGLIVEASLDGTDWTVLHQGLCHFGAGDAPGQPPPLVLPLAGQVELRFLRLRLPGRTYLHLGWVEILAEPKTSGRKTFLAARSDGFGERLRAMMNAMILAEHFKGDFRFVWGKIGASWDRSAHVILSKEKTFAPDFLSAYAVEANAVRSEVYHPIAGLKSIHAATRFRVGQNSLSTVVPELAATLPKDAGANAFRRIRFSDRLERARQAALDIDLAAGAVALHLRAGDILYGHSRLVGHYARKAIPWPLAFELAAQLRSEGRMVMVFGQDAALCRCIAEMHDCIFAGDIVAKLGLDFHQTVLFEITLMSRCAEVYAGDSGFALVACQIAGMSLAQLSNRLSEEDIRALLLSALEADSLGDPAQMGSPRTLGPDAISDLQRAFAFWSAASVHAALFDLEERSRLLAAAIARDPANSLYRLARIRTRLEAGTMDEAAAALSALAAEDAARSDDGLRFVLTKRNNVSGRPIVDVGPFADLARQGHAGALLCLALASRSSRQARESATQFLERRPEALSAYDGDVRKAHAAIS
jgi:hypothetical protein